MIGWDKKNWIEVDDPRDKGDREGEYESYMRENGYSLHQQFGLHHGYGYEVWSAGDNTHTWIITLSDGFTQDEVMVKGYPNFVDLMSHLGPGIIASLLDGEELEHLWSERALYRKQSEQIASVAKAAFQKVMDRPPCDCPACQARRETRKANAN